MIGVEIFQAFRPREGEPGTVSTPDSLRKLLSFKEPTDIVKAKGLIAGGLSADTSKDLRLRMGLDMLGVPYQYVTGYRSSPPARLALARGEVHMFSESPPSYRSVVVPQLITPGIAIPVFYDEIVDPPPASKQLEGLVIPSFPQLYKKIKGTAPDVWAVNVRCLEGVDLDSIRIERVHGSRLP